jgi:zinc/manganese transport system permease protein
MTSTSSCANIPRTLLLARDPIALGRAPASPSPPRTACARCSSPRPGRRRPGGLPGRRVSDPIFDPFALGFMRRALVGCVALSLAGPPLGVFRARRRMSLMTDVLQHGILPGVALGAGARRRLGACHGNGRASPPASPSPCWAARWPAPPARPRTATSPASTLSPSPSASPCCRAAVASTSPTSSSAASSASTTSPCSSRSAPPPSPSRRWPCSGARSPSRASRTEFHRAAGGAGALAHLGFLALVVLVAVAGFTALGTLMAVGLMMLPAVAAASGRAPRRPGHRLRRHRHPRLLRWPARQFPCRRPAGPAIVLTLGAIWAVSVLAGPRESLRRRLARPAHYAG